MNVVAEKFWDFGAITLAGTGIYIDQFSTIKSNILFGATIVLITVRASYYGWKFIKEYKQK